MDPFVIGPLIVGGATLIGWLLQQSQKKTIFRLNKELGSVSHELGIGFTEGKAAFLNSRWPSSEGVVNGFEILMQPRSERRGKHTVYFTVIEGRIKNNSVPGFTLQPEGWLTQLGESIGMKDAKINDRKFDERFRLKFKTDEQARFVLDKGIREQIHSLFNEKPPESFISLKGNILKYQEGGHLNYGNPAQRLKMAALILAAMAGHLENTSWKDGKPVTWWENVSGEQQSQ